MDLITTEQSIDQSKDILKGNIAELVIEWYNSTIIDIDDNFKIFLKCIATKYGLNKGEIIDMYESWVNTGYISQSAKKGNISGPLERTCVARVTKGPRKGKICGVLLKDDQTTLGNKCKIHR